MADESHVFTVAVIGAGPGGIGAAVQLKRNGIDDFVVVDRNDGVGGSWRANNYPGLGVDVPGLAYQFSFDRNHSWSRFFPKRDEILEYHEKVAEKFGVIPHTRFGVNVARERWNEDCGHGEFHTERGEIIRAQFVISAIGAFINPKEDPGIEGWREFKGKILRPIGWDWDYDLSGKRVAIVGTGASSVQITPSIAPKVGHLDVFQRTASWVLPKPDFAVPAALRGILGLPGVGVTIESLILAGSQIGLWLAIVVPNRVFKAVAKRFIKSSGAFLQWHVNRVVDDKDTAARLVAPYGFFFKRPTLSNEFLQAFNRDNVSLITTSIDRITETGVRTIDGVERPTDAIVLATGYEQFSDPETYREGTVVGRDGFDLGKFYNENKMQAYEGVLVPGLPNRWILVGPYSWNGTGWHTLVEASTAFAISGIRETMARGAQSIEVTADANARFFDMIQYNNRNLQSYYTELNKGRTYYVNSQGEFLYIRPTTVSSHRRAGKRLAVADYEFRGTAPSGKAAHPMQAAAEVT